MSTNLRADYVKGVGVVATYVVLINWTEQGVKTIKDTVQRYETAQAAGMKMGVKFKDFYWTMGGYDIVGIVEAPDDATISRFLLATGTLGNIRTVTMRAFSKDDMTQVLKGMP